jgi:hypothetical protein
MQFKCVFIGLFFCLTFNPCVCQKVKISNYKEIPVLIIKDTATNSIFDSVIACCKKCPYYIPERQFIFFHYESFSDEYILEAYYFNKVYIDDIRGGFLEYKKNNIIVSDSILIDKFFTRTSKLKKVSYNSDYEPSLYEPTSFSFSYIDNKFKLKFKYCRCR